MMINRYFELVLSEADFRTLVKYVDLTQYRCMYQAIDLDIEEYPYFEDTDTELLYQIFIKESALDDMFDDIDTMIWCIENEQGYLVAEELRELKEDIVYEIRNEYY